MYKFNIIVAHDENYGIGKDGGIPWMKTEMGKADMKMFKILTSKTNDKIPILIMGRNTYNSCPNLPGRQKVMISKNSNTNENTFSSVKDVIEYHQGHPIWICGGRNVYLEALTLNPTNIYKTLISGNYDCDVSIPEYSDVQYIDILTII